MRLAIDIRPLIDEYQTGVGTYTQSLINHLATLSPQDEFILFASGSAQVLRRLPSFKQSNVRIVRARIPNRWLNLQLKLSLACLEDWLPYTPDAWLLPKFNFYRTNLPYWLTVHDLAFEIWPEFITAKERLYHQLVDVKRLAQEARGLLAVSTSTAWDIEKLWQVPRERVHVTPLGVDHKLFTPHEQPSDKTFRAAYDLNRPYLLALATREPRKNLESVIEAYEAFRSTTPQSLPLVLVGSWGWKHTHLRKVMQQSAYAKDILSLGYIPHKHKPALYRGASCLIFPSFYEGFGLPVLEAMACGLPVITSSTGALPEVVGKAGIMVDPFNVRDVTQALQTLLSAPDSQELRQHLGQTAATQAKTFAWATTAELTLQAIHKHLN